MVEQQYETFVHLRLLSASDIKRGWLSGDQTYVIAWVDPEVKKRIASTPGGGETPQWHDELSVPFRLSNNTSEGKQLTIQIHSRGAFGDSLLGSVYVPMVELHCDGTRESDTILTYQVSQPSGKRQGSLKFIAKIMKFGDSRNEIHGVAESSFNSYMQCTQVEDTGHHSFSESVVCPPVSPYSPTIYHNFQNFHVQPYPPPQNNYLCEVPSYSSYYPNVPYPSPTQSLAHGYPMSMYPYQNSWHQPHYPSYNYYSQ